jgi:hypothetical protein
MQCKCVGQSRFADKMRSWVFGSSVSQHKTVPLLWSQKGDAHTWFWVRFLLFSSPTFLFLLKNGLEAAVCMVCVGEASRNRRKSAILTVDWHMTWDYGARMRMDLFVGESAVSWQPWRKEKSAPNSASDVTQYANCLRMFHYSATSPCKVK